MDTTASAPEEHTMSTRPMIPVGPVAPAVTPRVADLILAALSNLEQARYEGSHTARQDPEPVHGTPWTTPDMPQEVRVEIAAARAALYRAIDAGRRG